MLNHYFSIIYMGDALKFSLRIESISHRLLLTLFFQKPSFFLIFLFYQQRETVSWFCLALTDLVDLTN